VGRVDPRVESENVQILAGRVGSGRVGPGSSRKD